MHGHDGFRSFRYFGFDQSRIYAIRLRVNIHENGYGVMVQHRCRTCPKGKSGNNHLVARLYTHRCHAHVQRGSATVYRNTVFHTHVLGPLFCEAFRLGPLLLGDSSGLEYVHHSPLVGFRDMRPGLDESLRYRSFSAM